MILPLYQPHLRRQLSPAQYLLLEILVHLLQTLRCVKIETLAEGLPLPILFDSRRKKIQRFLSLPTLELETLWLPLVKLWLSQQYPQGSQLYVVIDRTSWGVINLLMVSVVWQHRAIPVWCEALCKKGSSNYDEQTAVLSKVIRHLSAYRLVILGDREFCSVKLGQWLGQQKVYFCLRLKRNTEVALAQQFTQQLQQFGLVPGQKLFLNDVRVTQAKGFGTFNVAAKWKRRYQGFAPDEAWFILTNFCDLNSAIVSYQKRFSIEEMFRDFKQGGYCLEGSQAMQERLVAIVIVIAIAYTSAALQGQNLKQKGLQRYITRPESTTSPNKRHSAFRVGLSAHLWAITGDGVLARLVDELMKLSPNKLPEYQRGMRAMELVCAGL
ncbi:IS4 family transposase (plasmid) [Acaryochloris sp. 'Moss Beach']|uniref:IS4 family transposase n=1 Tax=Acaryochloris sp. 'Moss Beach' TaxID=2740837 RepID=UPI001F3FC4E5|nr:IS4 family transposase [Acaryochloris sp. 'Moss Beach']UJB72841.1 IS4 family transposase [Acaryochloris sp. 'Moss Beach']